MNDVKTPLFRLAKRDELGRGKVWAIRAGSIIVALILGCIPMLLTGNSPAEAYGVILQGSLSRPIYIKQTVKIAIPLLGCALAIAPCFKMRFWNIGAEGQITMGAVAATFFAEIFIRLSPTPCRRCGCEDRAAGREYPLLRYFRNNGRCGRGSPTRIRRLYPPARK